MAPDGDARIIVRVNGHVQGGARCRMAEMRVFLRHVTRWVLPFAALGALVAYLLLRHDDNTNALSYAATYGAASALSGALFSLRKLREQS